MQRLKGFTLIEVLLGLTILSIALTALLITTGTEIKQTQRLKETMIKHWVAQQAINEIQLGLLVPSSSPFTTYKTRWLNQDWYWRLQIKKIMAKQIKSITVLTSSSRSGPFKETLTGYGIQT